MSESKTENGWTVLGDDLRYRVCGESRLAVLRDATACGVPRCIADVFDGFAATRIEKAMSIEKATAEIDALLDPQPENVIRGENFTAYKHEGRTTYVDRDRSGGWRACYGGAYTVTATREAAEAAARGFVMKGGAK